MNDNSNFLPSSCRSTTLLVATLFTLTLGGCNSTPPTRAYLSETFTTESPFQYYSSRDPIGACEIGKRALLSQGYQLEGTPSLTIRGEKHFQPKSEQVRKLTITLVCLPSSLGTVIYANALETQYELISRANTAGVSLSGMGSLSLPWTADKDTLVKTGEITVTEPVFYQKLFDLIKTLDG